MKKEFLTSLGLEDDVADKILSESSKELEAEKTTAAAKESELKAARDTISGLQEQIKKFNGDDVRQLQKDAEEWEKKYNAEKAMLESRLKQEQVESAVKLALTTAKAKNMKAAKALLEIDPEEAVIKEDGSIEGLDEKIKALMEGEDSRFLFHEESETAVHKFKGIKPGESSTDDLPDERAAEYQSRLADARKNNKTVEVISIKEEAALEGFILD